MDKYYAGFDIGNGTIKVVIINENNNLIDSVYLKNIGIIKTLSEAFNKIKHYKINSCGITGAGRVLSNIVIGADIIKTEIVAHTIGVLNYVPNVRTIIDLGKEDSKIIMVNNGIIEDCNMNINCSAGCGAYIDEVSQRIDIRVEEFAELALKSKNEAHIDAMCTVFGKSSAQNLLNTGIDEKDVLMGVARSLVRNYCNMFISGNVEEPVVFTGGVSMNKSVVKAFEEKLNCKIIVPENSHLMGAIGSAILSKGIKETKFKGWNLDYNDYEVKTSVCKDCGNECNIPVVYHNNKKIGVSYNGRCGKWK